MADFTVTIGATGRDYADPELAHLDIDTIAGSFDLPSVGNRVFGDIYDDATFADRFSFDGVTTNATYNVTYRRAAGSGQPLIQAPSGTGHTLTLLDNFIRFEGIDIYQQAAPSDQGDEVVRIGNLCEGVFFDRCRFGPANTNAFNLVYFGFYNVGSSSYPVTFRECNFKGQVSAFFYFQMIFGPWIHRCNVINCTFGGGFSSGAGGVFQYMMRSSGDELHLQIINSVLVNYFGANDIFYSGGSDNEGTLFTTGSTGNFKSNGTGILPGLGTPNPVTATENTSPGGGDWIIFEDVTNYADLRLVNVPENDVLNKGVGPSANALVSTLDYFGNTRSGATCDPGFHQVTPTATGIEGTVDVSDEDDSATASGVLEIEGTVDGTDEDDSATASGVLEIEGGASIGDEDDTVSATGTLAIEGAALSSDEDDTVSASGDLAIEGTAEGVDDDDAVSAAGSLEIEGTVEVSDENDAVSASGEGGNEGTVNIGDEDDSASASGVLEIEGEVGVSDEDDTVDATASAAIAGTATMTDETDTVSSEGLVNFAPLLGISGTFDPLLRRRTGKWRHPDHKYLCKTKVDERYSGRHLHRSKYSGTWSP